MELPPDLLRQAHYWMRLARALDDRGTFLHKQSMIVGGYFSQIGHEAVSVGAALALGPDDVAAPMHRDLGFYLARGITPRRVLAQFMGRATGVSRGRDANMHGMGDLSFGIVGFISHLPASLPVAAGMAHAFALRGEPRVAMAFYGDGSSSQGLAHETLNWASVFRLPVVFICENNQYAYSTPLSRQMNIADIADRAAGYGMPGVVVDGNDLAAVYRAAHEAVKYARAGGGPTLIECKTMRMRGHAIHDNMAYVPRDLLAEWERRDPIMLLETHMRGMGLLDDAGLAALLAQIEAELDEAQAFAEASPYPDGASVRDGVYA
ncbi:thiamine pyrophosphate-dependent dehydrogenase E1 component subunit alpha [Oscillochloris sp. ZM17-4]|uniref:thiamine pyrophosphate-dependent dehydrogenase E1 component subunit alpha n=1 Tax=Oscillochloris sp. ZM17-4 TaxID=2866714 RepID=UPI001C72A693|nr:thiamine pyrophosphate-dependent dehydrogenase E1 component subunit alpha [Oscillochloris sp. ZM17-4]MBX0326531.1 thiamine pyrophosphate-dependent dehydrogenase E1 component subunit alpha [Oscillochloris sp. ZM17-4]